MRAHTQTQSERCHRHCSELLHSFDGCVVISAVLPQNAEAREATDKVATVKTSKGSSATGPVGAPTREAAKPTAVEASSSAAAAEASSTAETGRIAFCKDL